jgi:hypothetical protein
MVNEWIDTWMNVWIDTWIYGWMDGWMDGFLDLESFAIMYYGMVKLLLIMHVSHQANPLGYYVMHPT